MAKEVLQNQKTPETVGEKPVLASLSELRNMMPTRKENPILAYLDTFDKEWKKRKRVLQSGEILFSPGEDPHFYIITKGFLNILRSTASGETREIGNAHPGSFIGEGILFGRTKKEVSAIAGIDDVEVFAVTKEDINKLRTKEPQAALDLYEHIIEVTNKRLLDTGEELATIYDATNKLSDLSEDEIGEQNFWRVLEDLTRVTGADYAIFVEQHPVVKWLFAYKYDTRTESKKPINEKAGKEISADLSGPLSRVIIRGTHPAHALYALPVRQHESLKGIIIFAKEKGIFTDNQVRIFKNIALPVAAIITDNQRRAEEKMLITKKMAC